MRITDLLKDEGILLNASVKDKQDAVNTLVNLHEKAGNLSDKESYTKGILAREEQGSTAIGEGIAIPHAKNAGVKNAGLAAMTVPDGVDYDALDGQPSNLFFMIAAPEKGGDVHLEVLSRLSTILMDEQFRKDLLAAKDKKEFLSIIDKKEIEKFGEEAKAEPEKKGYRILAVTACPTGIAHTFMAAEALEKKGAEMGYALKAETNGSGGAKNVLTKEEIEQADGIIVAADKNVEMARFEGKKVLKVKVADGIHKPQELIQKIIDGDAPVYHHHGAADTATESSGEKERIGRQIYKHLMNGVSHMLPFVIGGGILIAIAFLLDDYSINPSNFGSNTPLAAWFKTVGGTAFGFMLPILAGYIAYSIADRPGLAAGFVGGMIATKGWEFTDLTDHAAVPGFIGALFAGFAAGYLVLLLEKLCEKLPQSLEGIKPVLIYPVVGILTIGAVMCLVDPFFSWLNVVLADALGSMSGSSKIILGLILGGMMSVDMGGPVNKAAYVFGTGALANQDEAGFMIMAAVMVGGMVPPLVIALATTFFKNRFTAAERKSGPVNYIMGLCFISEGAIPYAAADPLRVIPSCVVGSATAGALSMAFGCTLRAPHGGLFVVPVIGNWPLFLLAMLIGSVVGMLLLAILKKPIKEEK
ncbi:MAG: PTS sugar transporter subunit IIA [Lachnospiraceae bacterium]|nr:PTS sugar transporter subunit IIA [Lachnospiraceae bacterium]MCR4802070.1 fructose-specific PTS transporter subunit EIIC [Lachnospiraceae bacterium]